MMWDAGSKIRALVGMAVFMGVLSAGAQQSGVGHVTPAALPNPALLGVFRQKWVWVGYEPSRFGIPELHWMRVGTAVPMGQQWRGAMELWGRGGEGFSQLRLQGSAAFQVTEFFAAGTALEVVRYQVKGGLPQWWGRVDLGVRARFGTLVVGARFYNLIPWWWAERVAMPQWLAFGLGWEERAWGCGFDAVIANSSPPHATLTITGHPTEHLTLTFSGSTAPVWLRLGTVVDGGRVLLEPVLGFHALLGWRHSLTLLYRWE